MPQPRLSIRWRLHTQKKKPAPASAEELRGATAAPVADGAAVVAVPEEERRAKRTQTAAAATEEGRRAKRGRAAAAAAEEERLAQQARARAAAEEEERRAEQARASAAAHDDEQRAEQARTRAAAEEEERLAQQARALAAAKEERRAEEARASAAAAREERLAIVVYVPRAAPEAAQQERCAAEADAQGTFRSGAAQGTFLRLVVALSTAGRVNPFAPAVKRSVDTPQRHACTVRICLTTRFGNSDLVTNPKTLKF